MTWWAIRPSLNLLLSAPTDCQRAGCFGRRAPRVEESTGISCARPHVRTRPWSRASRVYAVALCPCAVVSVQRAVHASAYDKNVEEQVRPAVVPDDVIGGAGNPDKYWGPHPKTGVFGPAAVDGKVAAGAPDAGANGGASVLDQKVWYRPLEDVEKPPPVA